jgi:hypothetical protein
MPAGSAYCIADGMLGDALRNVDTDGDGIIDHVSFSIRNQFLHPDHPLGWIRQLRVLLDGEVVPPDQMFFVLRGQWVQVTHIRTIRDIWWHMREVAEIYIRSSGITPGDHRIDVSFDVSLHVHTPNVDLDDLWPTLRQHLSREVRI